MPGHTRDEDRTPEVEVDYIGLANLSLKYAHLAELLRYIGADPTGVDLLRVRDVLRQVNVVNANVEVILSTLISEKLETEKKEG